MCKVLMELRVFSASKSEKKSIALSFFVIQPKSWEGRKKSIKKNIAAIDISGMIHRFAT